jgi:Bacterial Ig-like domain/Regulator of chromosome condensation (RCC1) repeat
VWAWGSNLFGGLGDGTTTNRNTPEQVSGLGGVVDVAGGNWHSLAVVLDKTAPEVSSTSPPNLATGVPATANISATFLEEGSGIDESTVTSDTFKVVQVKPTGNVPVSATAVSFNVDTQTATFDPSNSLATGLYRATLTGVADKAGNVMPDYTWTFATAGPSKR